MDALGIVSDDVVNYVFLRTWPIDREARSQIGEWLQTEARYLADARSPLPPPPWFVEENRWVERCVQLSSSNVFI